MVSEPQSTLLSLAEAQARLLALASPLDREDAPLGEAVGRWLAAPATAKVDHPFADLSAMDGYAIHFEDMPGPWMVVGESAAGGIPGGGIGAGQAMRIFTGAALPDGADAILIQEEAARDGDALVLAGEGPPARGAHVRKRGDGFRIGVEVLAAGTRLTPAAIGLAAMAGHASLPVRARPRVALLSTGDELVEPGADLAPGQIYNSNAPMLAALLAGGPTTVAVHPPLPDRLDAIRDAVREAAAASDVLVLTGGASVGDYDLVRPALKAEGAALDFWKVAMKPGKPVMAGKLGDCLVLGLPGNPVSAYVTALLFLKPLIAAMGGAADPLPQTIRLPLAGPLSANGARLEFLRARLADGAVHALHGQDSHALPTLAAAGALILRPPHAEAADAGMFADVLIIA